MAAAGGPTAKMLSRLGDVVCVTHGQGVSVDKVAAAEGFLEGVRRIQRAGYVEIVLIGYSAGGLLARQFVEDHPDAGVTKVVQVCTPNGGTPLLLFTPPWPPHKREYLKSLSVEARRWARLKRSGKKVSEHVEFVCIVGHGGPGRNDGLFTCKSQWPRDLQEQGVPTVPVPLPHVHLMHRPRVIKLICRLVEDRQPRWKRADVLRARLQLLGE